MLHNSINFSFLPLFWFRNFVISSTNCTETTLISFFIANVRIFRIRIRIFGDEKKISVPVVLEMNAELHFNL
jgi:hypothetical protein